MGTLPRPTDGPACEPPPGARHQRWSASLARRRPTVPRRLHLLSIVMGGLGSFLKKRWGVVLLVVGLLAWGADVIGPEILILVAVISVLYFLLSTPLRCIAMGRQGRCRNNAQGLLRGCHIREHKWQGFKALRGSSGEDRGVSSVLTRDRHQMTATLGVATGVVSALLACADFILK